MQTFRISCIKWPLSNVLGFSSIMQLIWHGYQLYHTIFFFVEITCIVHLLCIHHSAIMTNFFLILLYIRIGAFFFSWLLGTFLMVSVMPPLLKGPRSLEVTTSLISYVLLWVSSTFLKQFISLHIFPRRCCDFEHEEMDVVLYGQMHYTLYLVSELEMRLSS